jgi:hypothetical protein
MSRLERAQATRQQKGIGIAANLRTNKLPAESENAQGRGGIEGRVCIVNGQFGAERHVHSEGAGGCSATRIRPRCRRIARIAGTRHANVIQAGPGRGKLDSLDSTCPGRVRLGDRETVLIKESDGDVESRLGNDIRGDRSARLDFKPKRSMSFSGEPVKIIADIGDETHVRQIIGDRHRKRASTRCPAPYRSQIRGIRDRLVRFFRDSDLQLESPPWKCFGESAASHGSSPRHN